MAKKIPRKSSGRLVVGDVEVRRGLNACQGGLAQAGHSRLIGCVHSAPQAMCWSHGPPGDLVGDAGIPIREKPDQHPAAWIFRDRPVFERSGRKTFSEGQNVLPSQSNELLRTV